MVKELVPHLSKCIKGVRSEYFEELLTEEEIEYIENFISGINEDQMCTLLNFLIEVCQDYILHTIGDNLVEDLSHLVTYYIVQEGKNDTSLN